MENYDLIVIGAGPGGYTAAIRAAQLGMRVAIAECREAGGTCLNRGCIPTKALLHAARLYRELNTCGAFGLHAENVSFDFPALHARKAQVVGQLRGGVEGLLAANGVAWLSGRAVIEAPGLVRVDGDAFGTARILIAVGGAPARPPIPGVELPGVFDSDGLLENDVFPARLTIIGGGVIGMEFATLYRDLGAEVTVVEAMDRILPPLDRELSQNLSMILKKRGVRLLPKTAVERITREDGRLDTIVSAGGKQECIPSEAVLVATGRKPATEGLCGPGVDLRPDRGFLPVDASFETCVRGVYAIGDVVKGGVQLAHAASAQGIRAVSAMAGRSTEGLDVVPSCVYTDPEIASVGMTADEAKAAGIPIKTGKALTASNSRSLIEGLERGFVKLVFHGETGTLLGAQLMCGRASDLIGELASAVQLGLTSRQLLRVVRPHPSFCESITEAVEAAEGMAIHAAPGLARRNS